MSAAVVIRRARFAPDGDALAAQLKLDRALAAADWSVPGLPPSAILCARRLRARARAPGAIRAALAVLARGAVRPAREFVPAAAEAVWFADLSEWLACLARDMLAGELATRWWWAAVRRDSSGTRAAAREWLAVPASTPAAWRLLAEWNLAPAFAAALESADAVALTRATCAAFGLRLSEGAAPMLGNEQRAAVREAPALSPGPRRAALALGLLLARRPHRAHRDAAGVLAWAEFGTEHPEPVRARTSDPGTRVEQEHAPDRAPEVTERRADATPVAPEQTGSRARPHTESGIRPAPERASDSAAAERGSLPAPRADVSKSNEGAPVPANEQGREAEPVPRAVAAAERAPDPEPRAPLRTESQFEERGPVPERIDTAFGGLLYLVNVALALDLYPDFTEPARPGIALPLWDWLALLGRRWFGDEFRADPLDGLLAALAGRDAGTSPGTDIEPPNEWRLPESWRPWCEAPECAWGTLADWFDWLAPVVERRLASALGMSDASAAARWLVRRRAALFVPPAHVDVMLALDELAVEVRLALLDRDPGWLPATGTTVRFHYESR